MKEKIIEINNKIEPYYKFAIMCLAILSFMYAAYNFFLPRTDLLIKEEVEKISYPTSIENTYNIIGNYILNKDTLLNESMTLDNFFHKTTEQKKITLKNISDKTINGVNFKYLNVNFLTAWGVSTNYTTTQEESNLLKDIEYDENRKIIYLKNEISLPPNSEINIILWGNFNTTLLNSNTIANYSDGDAYLERSYILSGFRGYIYYYSIELFTIIIIVLLIGYITLFKKEST